MRTTVSLDDDLVVRLEQRRAERGMTFKDILNDTVRRGLAAENERGPAGSSVVATRPLTMGKRLVDDIDSVADALTLAEGESFR